MNTPNGPLKKAGGMTVREAGQKGGETVKKKYGPEFYEQIGRKGGQATKNAHGHAFYEQIGKKGGKKVEATKAKPSGSPTSRPRPLQGKAADEFRRSSRPRRLPLGQ